VQTRSTAARCAASEPPVLARGRPPRSLHRPGFDARPFHSPRTIARRASLTLQPLPRSHTVGKQSLVTHVIQRAFAMRFSRLSLVLLSALLVIRATAEDEDAPKSHMKEVLRARALEEAKKNPVAPARPAASTPAPSAKAAEPAKPDSPASAPAAANSAPAPSPAPAQAENGATPAKPEDESTIVLPKVEVKKDRITILDHQLHEQEKAIAREKKNVKETETDKALNDARVSKALSIFGGESASYRANIAKERVSLMDDEKDLLEAIAFAKTKEEKQELQKQLDELRALRRDLEKSLK